MTQLCPTVSSFPHPFVHSISSDCSMSSHSCIPTVSDSLTRVLDITEEVCVGRVNRTMQLKEAQKIRSDAERMRIAIIVVDFQNDFVSGSLAIGEGPAGQNPLGEREGTTDYLYLRCRRTNQQSNTTEWYSHGRIHTRLASHQSHIIL